MSVVNAARQLKSGLCPISSVINQSLVQNLDREQYSENGTSSVLDLRNSLDANEMWDVEVRIDVCGCVLMCVCESVCVPVCRDVCVCGHLHE